MSKVARIQRPLFDPWLDWDQLPEEIRQQALDVLTAFYLEVVDVPRLGEQTSPNVAGSEREHSTSIPASPRHGVTNR
jgi:hypothetical protein